MAPVAPSKRRPLRAKLAAKAGAEPHAPRKAPRPDAVAPSTDGFTSTKKDKKLIKHSAFMSRVEKAHQKPLKRRRPSKKLVTNLQSLADALPDLQARDEGKVRHKSLKMRKGALKKKEKIVKGEMDRFNHSLAHLNAMGARSAGTDMQIEKEGQSVDAQARAQGEAQDRTASTANTWAALRHFLSSTLEKNPAFLEK